MIFSNIIFLEIFIFSSVRSISFPTKLAYRFLDSNISELKWHRI
ncbi:hypothetical protein [Clostridium tetani]|nr:hypothetical protein [Clostridium tetani]